MIAVNSVEAYETGIAELRAFGESTGARGRFIALYLGFRLMGDLIAPLASSQHTLTSEIEQFMDRMWTKTNRPPPHNVLTAPFGGGGVHGGYSTATGVIAPGNSYPTNTWRNNLNSQKGIGCVAPPIEIADLIEHDDPRAACPHYVFDGVQYMCAISGAKYRGEKHSIWLGRSDEGFQVVDLSEPSAYEPYLRPGGARIPIYPLLATLYCFAPTEVYPLRREVSIAEFEADFELSSEFTAVTFDCDPASLSNARTLAASHRGHRSGGPSAVATPTPTTTSLIAPPPLPALPDQFALNSGLQAEIAVGLVLQEAGWIVYYTGGQPSLGYDLRAESATTILHVEVKSSVGYVTPILTESEWRAAGQLGESFILALVDHVGSARQSIRFVHGPALHLVPAEKQAITYRLPRSDWEFMADSEVPAP